MNKTPHEPAKEAIAPDLIGAHLSDDMVYPVNVVVEDHELGRIVLKLTDYVASVLRHDLTSAIKNGRRRQDVRAGGGQA